MRMPASGEELTGALVRLRPLRESDLAKRAEWTADDELVSLMGADPAEAPFVSAEDEVQSNREWLRGRQRAGDQLYAIEVAGTYIGDIDVEFFRDDGKAEMTVFIGVRTSWGKGYGTESVQLVLEELRAQPGIDRVEVDVPKGNERSLGFWQKLGFAVYAADDDGRRWLRRLME